MDINSAITRVRKSIPADEPLWWDFLFLRGPGDAQWTAHVSIANDYDPHGRTETETAVVPGIELPIPGTRYRMGIMGDELTLSFGDGAYLEVAAVRAREALAAIFAGVDG